MPLYNSTAFKRPHPQVYVARCECISCARMRNDFGLWDYIQPGIGRVVSPEFHQIILEDYRADLYGQILSARMAVNIARIQDETTGRFLNSLPPLEFRASIAIDIKDFMERVDATVAALEDLADEIFS